MSTTYGVIYLGSWNESKVYAYDASQCAKGRCSPLWTATTGGATECAPAVANGVVYAGSNDSILYAFNAATGATLWQQRIGGSVPRFSSCPSVVNGALYAGVTFNFALYKFRLPEATP